MRVIVVMLAQLLAPAATFAGSWTPPEGCEVFMTVQAKACRVSQYYRCIADPHGHQWRADFDQEGIFFQSRVDAEGQWIESITMNPTLRQTLDANPKDPASFSELLAEEVDTFQFGLTREDGFQTQVDGFDRLTGKTVVIDGIELSQTEFEATEADPSGQIVKKSRGNEYIHPEWRLFFAGPGKTDLGGPEMLPIDGSPVEFIFPGEPGFLSTLPIFDCDAVVSELEQSKLRPVPASFAPRFGN
jgi:hypothetical protein